MVHSNWRPTSLRKLGLLIALGAASLTLASGCRTAGAAVGMTLDVTGAAIDTTIDVAGEAVDGSLRIVGLRSRHHHHHEHTTTYVSPGKTTCEDGTVIDWDELQRTPEYEADPNLPPPTRVRRREDFGDVRPGRWPLAFLGVRFQAPNKSFSYEQDGSGVRIEEIISGSSAHRAGLRAGDLVTKVGGIAVETPEDLMLAIRVREVGEEVEITFIRRGVEQTITVRLGFRSRPT